MELRFSNDLESAKRLDEMMNSYSGRDCGSVMADEDSLAVVLFLLEHGEITVTEHAYPYDRNIRNNREMMAVYTELARQTRWKRGGHTEIESIRVNALRQTQQEGDPFYDGDFICCREGHVCVHCGNLTLPGLLLYLADHEQAERFYLFSYPYWTKDDTAKYYRFDLSETAIQGARIYRESIWEKMRKASAIGSALIPELNEPPQ